MTVKSKIEEDKDQMSLNYPVISRKQENPLLVMNYLLFSQVNKLW